MQKQDKQDLKKVIEYFWQLGNISYWEYNPVTKTFILDDHAAEMLNFSTEQNTLQAEQFYGLYTPEEKTEIENKLVRTEASEWLMVLTTTGKKKKRVLRFRTSEKAKPGNIVHGIIEDVTGVTEAGEDMEKRIGQLQQADHIKSLFLSHLSNELRNPMNAITGFAELIRLGNISPETRREYSEIISKKGKDLLHLIDDIIEINLLEQGEVILNKKPCNINSMMHELHHETVIKAKDTGHENIEIHLAIPADECWILTDPGHLQQVLQRLADNAIKFTEKGAITIGFEIKEPKSVYFYVTDTGIGLRKDEIKTVFDRFKQHDQTLAAKGVGPGLGLSLARNLVQVLGGKIGVESEFAKGSTFWFTIPYQPSEEHENAETLTGSDLLPEYQWKNKVILVVEDDELNARFLEAILDQCQVQLIFAADGEQALELCQSIANIDLVLMDIRLPKMNGMEAFQKIRNLRPRLPVIAQTALASKEERDACLATGFNDYISKPFDIPELMSMLQKYLAG